MGVHLVFLLPVDRRWLHMHDQTANSEFYRELAAYLQSAPCFPAALELENSSGGMIHDARLEIELADPDRLCELLGSEDRPRMPE